MKTQLVFLVAYLALIPAAGAQNGEPTLDWHSHWHIGLDQIEFKGNLTLSGADAATQRRLIDQNFGNRDGTVTAAEVAAYKRSNQRTYSEDKPECFEDFQFLRIDGKGPLRVSYWRFEAEGAEGPTSSQVPMQQITWMGFRYASPTSDDVAVSMYFGENGFYSSLDCFYDRDPITPPEDDGSLVYVLLLHPLGDAQLAKDSIRPANAQGFWDGQGIRYESWGPELPDRLNFTMERRSLSGTVTDVGALVAYSVAGTVGVLGVMSLFTEVGRYHFLRFLFLLPGFTRVQKEAVLEHAKREELYNFIKSNQGPSFSDLRRSLELSNGNLIHHLRILEMQGYVTGQRDGFRKRFYIRGPKVVPSTYLTRTQQQLLDIIGAHPGLTQKELSGLVGLPRELVFYHTKQLALRGRLEIKQDGNRRRYWLSATAAPAPTGLGRAPT